LTLTGPAHDARNVQRFLVDGLGLPSSNVITLIDQEATRNNIFRVLNDHLLQNSRIRCGDPIIFYYAGHGTTYPTSIFWPRDEGIIEAILPVDRGQNNSDMKIPDIHDFEINNLLEELHAKRSANITVILDCGFHSSASRQPKSASEAKRHTHSLPYSEQECRFLRGKYAPRQRNLGISTFVRILACEMYEHAWESYGMGLFTDRLLIVLRQLPLSRTTYEELQCRLRDPPIPHQHPVVSGPTKDFLFRVGQNTSGTVYTSLGATYQLFYRLHFRITNLITFLYKSM
jgi:Caspase domain